jgi:hypothetical protein
MIRSYRWSNNISSSTLNYFSLLFYIYIFSSGRTDCPPKSKMDNIVEVLEFGRGTHYQIFVVSSIHFTWL